MAVPGPFGAALALLGWALACYFLLGTVTALTRRDTGGALTASRTAVLGEAVMGFGTVVMLIAFT
jgi:ABC-type transporter lipoprotein component MlaA